MRETFARFHTGGFVGLKSGEVPAMITPGEHRLSGKKIVYQHPINGGQGKPKRVNVIVDGKGPYKRPVSPDLVQMIEDIDRQEQTKASAFFNEQLVIDIKIRNEIGRVIGGLMQKELLKFIARNGL